MNKKIILCISIISILLQGCVIITELIPQKPSPSIHPREILLAENLIDDNNIGIELLYVDGFNEPHTPPNVKPTEALEKFLMETKGNINLNQVGIVRVYNKTKKADKIQIIITGIYSGAGTNINLAKAIVKRDENIEVWVIERRSNQLEDRRKILKAIKENKPTILLDMVEKDKFVLKKDAFYRPSKEDISFLAYWGLNTQLKDIYNVVNFARERANEIILSGYSLGVLYVTNFLGMDFDETENVLAGYTLVDKVILYDGPTVLDGYIKTESQYLTGVYAIPANFIDGKKPLEENRVYPANGNGGGDISPFILSDIKMALALILPDSLSIEPYKNLPITNLAKFLVEFDDNYLMFKLFTGSFGRADAKHSGKFGWYDTVKITGLSENKKYIDWIPRKEGDCTEFNNYRDYLWAGLNEYCNMAEWYQPTRILLDFGSIHNNDTSKGWQKKYFNVTQTKNINNKFLCIGLSRGLSSRVENYLKYKNLISSNDFTIIMIDGITHLDGDTMSDNGTRQIVADITYNWLNNRNIVTEKAKENKKACHF
ncbi:MAG TPA: hypothetical protein PLE45_09085 [Spirochaetota bacterium]|nr:hypothetical protein [Spirochaetota bacterium]HOL57217.1 hypothetical protein [Spirochaetota bacterium]HPP03568.1 hypothetical protein [Spirochaetota bacterium]